MNNLSPKQTNMIDDIIRSANPLFFGKLSKLLGTIYPATLEEKEGLMKSILRAWEEKNK